MSYPGRRGLAIDTEGRLRAVWCPRRDVFVRPARRPRVVSDPMPVELLRVGPDEIAVFDSIADEVFDAAIERERLEAYLAEPGHLMILAVEAGVVVAQCAAVVHRHPDKVTELYVDELGTAASHRRQGIARRLIEAMFDWGRELGCKESWLGTELDNVEANGLYLSIDHRFDTMAYYEFKL